MGGFTFAQIRASGGPLTTAFAIRRRSARYRNGGNRSVPGASGGEGGERVAAGVGSDQLAEVSEQ
jgi:hypothetical protein